MKRQPRRARRKNGWQPEATIALVCATVLPLIGVCGVLYMVAVPALWLVLLVGFLFGILSAILGTLAGSKASRVVSAICLVVMALILARVAYLSFAGLFVQPG